MKAVENAIYCQACVGKILWGAPLDLALQFPADKGESACHGMPVYQLPIAGFINEIEFGTEEEAEKIINGWYCLKCNKICEVIGKKGTCRGCGKTVELRKASKIVKRKVRT